MSVSTPASKSLRVDRRLPPSLGRGIRIAAIAVIAAVVLTVTADAKGGGRGGGGGISMGGGGRGGGFGAHSFRGPSLGGGRSISAPRIGSGRSISAPRIGGPRIGARSHGGARTAVRSHGPATTRAAARLGPGGASNRLTTGGPGNRLVTGSTRAISAPGSLARNITRGQAVLGNRFITNSAWRAAIAPVRFHGGFLGSPWPWWYGGIVIGWVGPVFWPYVYDDFWLYAYDDIYYGIYGPYAYAGPPRRVVSHRPTRAVAAAERPAGVCSTRASDLTDWPIGRIVETVQPTDAQRAALEALKEASAKAVDMLRNACPQDLPSIPTGRLAAMEARLEVMLAAVKTVRPALAGFYQSLGDEQKARFNAVAPSSQTAAAKDQRDFTRLCDGRSPGVTDLPIERIAQAIGPTEPQRAALEELKQAMLTGGSALKANCPTYQSLTPVGRVEAMEQRLEVTLGAAQTVKPALAKLYGMLTDEQKARFNALRSIGSNT